MLTFYLSGADKAVQKRQAFLTGHNPNFDITKQNRLINECIRFSLCLALFGSNFLKCSILLYMSLVLRKPVFWVSDQVRHKPGCTTTECGKMLEIPDLEIRGIVVSM